MLKVKIYNPDYDPGIPAEIVIIGARYKGNWVFVKNRDREGYELPAGHIEKNEQAIEAAERELTEETGASDFTLKCIGVYTVEEKNSFRAGVLFLAYIDRFGAKPDFDEIEEVVVVNKRPSQLSFAEIQGILFDELVKNI